MDSLDFINICRQDLDRLIEQSPQVPDDIIEKFSAEFEHQEDLSKPDICNNIEHTSVYNNSKTRMKILVAELALNMRHKKRILRDEVLPDLDKRMKELVDKTFRDYEKRITEQKKEQDKFGFLSDVRKKLGEVVDTIGEIHVTQDRENVVVDINSSSAVSPAITDVIQRRRQISN